MRFRTKITNAGLMGKIVKSLSSSAKSCVIKLTPETVCFIVSGKESGPEGVQIWSSIKIRTLFDEYRIESRTSNEIHLELLLEPLSKALRSAEMAGSEAEVGIKLSKKDGKACLRWDIVTQGAMESLISIAHDVACTVLAPNRVADLKEPLCPVPDIHVNFPSLLQLKGLAGRLGHLGNAVNIAANKKGEMYFTVEDQGLEVVTKWTKLAMPKFRNPQDPPEEEDPEKFYNVTIGVKSLQKFLATNMTNTTTIACICDSYCLIAYVYIGEPNEAAGVLTIFIPRLDV